MLRTTRALLFTFVPSIWLLLQSSSFEAFTSPTAGNKFRCASSACRCIGKPETGAALPVLTYFGGYGLAEQIRWMLAAGDIEWNQVALKTHEEFLDLRKAGKLFFGQLPLLEIDGLRLVQSQAMLRYVAQRAGLWGKDLAESALVDMVAEGIRDARSIVVSFPFTDDQAGLAAEAPSRVAKQMMALEVNIRKHADGTFGFLPRFSAADVLLAELVEELVNIRADSVNRYPSCAALHKQVVALPRIQAYLSGPQRYPFPRGQVRDDYVNNVQTVLGR